MTTTTMKLTDEQLAAVETISERLKQGKQVQTLGGFAGCLSGTTQVLYNRGTRKNHRLISLRDMYLKFNGSYVPGVKGSSARWDQSLTTYLSSFWPDLTVRRNEVVAVFQSGIKPVIRLDFDDMSHLVLTPDHPVANPSGEFVAAGNLVLGSEVLCRGTMMKCAEGKGRRPLSDRPDRVIVNTRFHPNGSIKVVECNGVLYTYMRVPRARLVFEAHMNDVPYSEFVNALKCDPLKSSTFAYLDGELDVHHKDENPMNDDITNLEILTHAEHARHHDPEHHFKKDYTRTAKVIAIQSAGQEMTYDVQMTDPANNFCANGVFVHNTGKTTILKELRQRIGQFAVCAFTGKAAQVLRNKGMEDASTIHSLIYSPREQCSICDWIKPKEDEHGDEVVAIAVPPCNTNNGKHVMKVRFLLKPPSFMEHAIDGFLVDEASMVGQDIHKDLMSFNLPIIYVGDHGQLPPVGSDGFNLMENPDIKLETIHRNAGIIARFAEHLRKGRDAKDWDSFVGHMATHFTGKGEHGTIRVIRPNQLGEINVSENDQFICAYNRTRSNLNRTVRSFLDHDPTGPVVGDRIMCLENNRDLGLFNGMQGRIAKIDRANWVLFLEVNDELTIGPVHYNPKAFGSDKRPERVKGRIPFDWSYCVTAHKFQGDEANHVIVMEERCDLWQHSQWTYTAASRAKNELTWVLEA